MSLLCTFLFHFDGFLIKFKTSPEANKKTKWNQEFPLWLRSLMSRNLSRRWFFLFLREILLSTHFYTWQMRTENWNAGNSALTRQYFYAHLQWQHEWKKKGCRKRHLNRRRFKRCLFDTWLCFRAQDASCRVCSRHNCVGEVNFFFSFVPCFRFNGVLHFIRGSECANWSTYFVVVVVWFFICAALFLHLFLCLLEISIKRSTNRGKHIDSINEKNYLIDGNWERAHAEISWFVFVSLLSRSTTNNRIESQPFCAFFHLVEISWRMILLHRSAIRSWSHA